MKVATVPSPGGLDKLSVSDQPAPGEPGPGEIRVRVHASSLNFHDYSVVSGVIPTEDGRIPMSDGAGVVEAVGEGVKEFAVGDNVVSTFFAPWLEGEPQQGNFTAVPGDGMDGYAREQVVRPTNWFTHAPRVTATPGRHSHDRRPHRLARAHRGQPHQGWRHHPGPGYRRRLHLCVAVRPPYGRQRHRHLLVQREARAAQSRWAPSTPSTTRTTPTGARP